MTDAYAWWRAALAGENPATHPDPDQAQCGYFKMRDRRGLNKNLAPIKRPWVACAIWRDEAGELKAELAGAETSVERLWPYCTRHPIPYETYAHWHQHEAWPREAA